MSFAAHALKSASEICVSCAARNHGFCGMLDGSCLGLIAGRSQPAHYKRSAEILLQGEETDRIGIVRSGLVKVVLLTEDGDHQVLQVLKPRQIVGDPCKTWNAFSWEAATAADICWIQRPTLNLIMKDHPQVYRAYLDVIARQLEEHRLWAASMRGRNTVQRIAFWIFQQVPDIRDGGAATIHIALTRRDLASLLDMTVETLCRGLYQLSDRDAIRLVTPETIEVLNNIKLRLLARCGDGRVSNVLKRPDPAVTTDNPFCISISSAHAGGETHVARLRSVASDLGRVGRN